MSSDLIWAVVRLLVALPLVLGLAYLVLKYGLARRYVITSGYRRMKLMEQLPLGPKTTLSLVGLGGRYYLLAHQENSISLVKELNELPEPEESKIGEIVELTPRTLEEYDRLQKSGEPVDTRQLPVIMEGKFGPQLKKLAGWVAWAQKTLSAKLAARKRTGEKGDRKVEG